MNTVTTVLAALLCIHQSKSPGISVRVDPRLEVLALTMWLAGEYPSPSDSAYKLRTWNHFKRFRDHPAVLAIKKAKAIYPDFTELGVATTGWPKPKPGGDNSHWRTMVGQEAFDAYFAALPDFIAKSGFERYFQSNQPEFERCAAEFQALMVSEKIVETMESFFRYGSTRTRPKFEVFLEPLNGWGAHAIVNKAAERGDSSEPVRYQIGYLPRESSFLDSPMSFRTTSGLAGVAWHEGSHVYIGPVFYANSERIATEKRLFNKDMLISQNIETWEYCLNENVVRAITAVLIKLTKGEAAYQREIVNEVKQNGFIYTGDIAGWILKDYVGNPTYKTFDDFFPVILDGLKGLPDYSGTH